MVVAKYLISAEPLCTPQKPRHHPGFLLRKSETNVRAGSKNSVRACVFRFALELGHYSMQSACLKRATTGRSTFP
jgi:hypothetical protein